MSSAISSSQSIDDRGLLLARRVPLAGAGPLDQAPGLSGGEVAVVAPDEQARGGLPAARPVEALDPDALDDAGDVAPPPVLRVEADLLEGDELVLLAGEG